MKNIFSILQIDKITANMRFEINVLLRGWFFRIFAALVLIIFTVLDILFFTNAAKIPRPRAIIGLSAYPAYSITLFLNLFQTAALIFLASDLFNRYKKYNTMEVVFIRSMSNAALVGGRTVGILSLFLLLDILLLAITAVIHFVFGNTNFEIVPWLLYFMLITIPSMIFTVGLTFLLIRFVKNQAVVILSLLGYAALIIFYLKDSGYFIYDFPAMFLPLIYSDFTGIAQPDLIIYQRGFYFLIGLALMSLTVLFFPRLPQSALLRRSLAALTLLFLAGAGFLSQNYFSHFRHNQELRAQMISLNRQAEKEANIIIKKCAIDLSYKGDKISAVVPIVFNNPHDTALENIYFCLNPGLIVSSIKQNGAELKFKQSAHIVKVFLKHRLAPFANDSLIMEYSGVIDEAADYLDIPQEEINKRFNIWFYQIFKKYAFVTKNYLLLSPESMWYPSAQLPADINQLFPDKKSFIDFSLRVTADSSMTAVSQGKETKLADGITLFRPEQPLPSLSLIIGQYERRRLYVDSLEVNLYVLPKHTYFDKYFTEIGDTLPAIIRESKNDYENRAELTYPFKRFSIIEVPIQFYSYARARTVAEEVTQPEQVWLAENGTLTPDASFFTAQYFNNRRKNWTGQTITDLEIQINLIRTFINSTFFGAFSFLSRFGPNFYDYRPQYSPFPNYYSFSNYVASQKWPVFNTAFENYLKNRGAATVSAPKFIFFSSGNDLTPEEETNLLLQKKSLRDLIHDTDEVNKIPAILNLKGDYLFKEFEKDFQIEDFNQKINRFVEKYRFQKTDIDSFWQILNNNNEKEAVKITDEWFRNTNMPGYKISQVEMFKVVDRERMRYQVLFTVENPEPAEGIIDVTFQYRGFFRRMMSGKSTEEEPPRTYKIGAGQMKQIGIILESEPQSIVINTLISKNLPQQLSIYFDKADEREHFIPFDGEKVMRNKTGIKNKGIIVVDNVDSSFHVQNLSYQSFLKKWIQGSGQEAVDEYKTFRPWDIPNRWTLFKNSKLYGKYINSAYYIKSGSGKKKAVWQTDIREPGLYDVYCYSIDFSSLFEGRRRHRGRRSHGGSIQDFHYTVYSDAGSDEVAVDMGNAYLDWTLLGSYYFSKGDAKVELSDKSKGDLVVADAVKWVKK